MSNREKFVLFIIIFISIALRFINLQNTPAGFLQDEAAIGYNAYSLIKTGKDEFGNFLPLYFKSFGDYKLPLYVYLTIPSILIFGLNEFSVRAVSAIFGSLSVLVTFFLAKELVKDQFNAINNKANLAGFMASILLAISPWHIFTSRVAFEANLGIFIFGLAVLLLLKAKKESRLFIASFLLFGVSLFTYHSYRVFTPLFIFTVVLFHIRSFKSKIYILSITFFLGFFLLALSSVLGLSGVARFSQVGLTKDVGLLNRINEQRGVCAKELNGNICKIFYNKYTNFSSEFIKNYVLHYSPELLFVWGGYVPQQSMINRGLLYILELPFLLLGVIIIFRNFILEKKLNFLLPWFLFYPLADSLTGVGVGNRMLCVLPLWQILISLGLVMFLFYLKQRIRNKILLVLFLLMIMSFGKFLVDYFVIYKYVGSRYFQFGYKEIFNYVRDNKNSYDRIIISRRENDGKQYIFYLFYNKIDPALFQEKRNAEYFDGEDGWVIVKKIDKVMFVDSLANDEINTNDLLIASPKEFKVNVKPIKVIKLLDGEKIFWLVRSSDYIQELRKI